MLIKPSSLVDSVTTTLETHIETSSRLKDKITASFILCVLPPQEPKQREWCLGRDDKVHQFASSFITNSSFSVRCQTA